MLAQESDELSAGLMPCSQKLGILPFPLLSDPMSA